ncbi:MAG: hypothetical protein QM751_09090 [Paludibacteraceae bacterium]
MILLVMRENDMLPFSRKVRNISGTDMQNLHHILIVKPIREGGHTNSAMKVARLRMV